MNAELERLAAGDSFLHRWDARCKLASLLLFMLASASLRHPGSALLALGFSQALIGSSALPFSLILRRLKALHLILIPCFILLPFRFVPSQEGWTLIYSQEGFVFALTLYLRALAILTASMALIYTTPFHRLLRAAESLGVPSILIQISLLTYRYVFTLSNEFRNMRWALATRGFQNRFQYSTYRSLANVTGTLLLRSLERTERVYRAMQCRGYAGVIHTLEPFSLTHLDWVKSGMVIALSLLLFLVDRWP